ncbi:hypothetical protein V6R97_08855 [Chromohalobacter salexigens]|uniref:hypothetical protein n=1 Tax=Chromohalobacter israelensis TaxID=141390 RepID=UPI0032E8B597
MGIVIVKQPTATVEMDVDVPQVGKLGYDVTWTLLSADELKALEEQKLDIVDVIVEHCKGIEGPRGLEESEAPKKHQSTVETIDEDGLREILQINYYRRALAQSFFATQQGRAVYAAKN